MGYLTFLLVALASTHVLAKDYFEYPRKDVAYFGIDTITSQEILEDLRNISMPSYDQRSLLGCGNCFANLEIGDRGYIESPGYPLGYPMDQSCLWLLHTIRDAEIRLICNDIQLDACVERDDSRKKLPSYNDVLIISPTWQFTKSWVYCGEVTKSIGTIMHTSNCNKMAVIFKSDGMGSRRGFRCEYSVVKSYYKK